MCYLLKASQIVSKNNLKKHSNSFVAVIIVTLSFERENFVPSFALIYFDKKQSATRTADFQL